MVAPLKRLICCARRKQKAKEIEARMTNLKQELEMDEHQVSIDELYQRYDVDSLNGLTSTQVADRHKLYGQNCLTPPKKTPEWKKFCKQLFGGFSLLLWFGSILCFVAYIITDVTHDGEVVKDNLFLGLILAAVVIISGCFSYYQVG